LELASANAATRHLATGLETAAALFAADGAAALAARLYGAAGALRQATGAALLPADRSTYERNVAALRATIGAGDLEAGQAQGAAQPLDEVLATALQALDRLAAAGS
jgi:hypothetical protein